MEGTWKSTASSGSDPCLVKSVQTHTRCYLRSEASLWSHARFPQKWLQTWQWTLPEMNNQTLKKFFFDCLNNIYKKAKKQSPFATALPTSPLLSVPPGNSWAYSKSTFLTWKDLVPLSRQPVPWDGVCSSEKVLRFSWTAVTEQQQPGFPQVCDNRIPSLIPRMCLETGMFTVLPQELFRVSISLPWPLCKQLDHCSWL